MPGGSSWTGMGLPLWKVWPSLLSPTKLLLGWSVCPALQVAKTIVFSLSHQAN